MVHRDMRDQERLSTLHGFPTPVSGDTAEDLTVKEPVERKPSLIMKWMDSKAETLQGCPWFGWAFVYASVLLVFFVFRCATLGPLIMMYGSSSDFTAGVVIAVLSLGLLEDFVCATYFVCVLWLFDAFKSAMSKRYPQHSRRVAVRVGGRLATFIVSWILFIAVAVPCVADLLLVRIRSMRFTFDLVAMAIAEQDNIGAASVSNEELDEGYANAVALGIVATLFAIVRTCASWADLSRTDDTSPSRVVETRDLSEEPAGVQDSCRSTEDSESDPSSPTEEVQLKPVQPVPSSGDGMGERKADEKATKESRYVTVDIHEGSAETVKPVGDNKAASGNLQQGSNSMTRKKDNCKRCTVALVGLAIIPGVVVAISRGCSPLIAYSALNTTLNELLGHALQPTAGDETATTEDGSRPWAETFIDSTEEHTLLGDDTLYRRTTGFHGDLAFDVDVSEKDPPNVLLLVVESFRFHDSHFLVGKEDPSDLFKGTNMTITPNFDKWAKRGIALRNYWSSWRTSRSVESLLFGQLPYDSVTKSGMTGGQRSTKLAGLPQMFTAKGYETFFTTGCKTNYDGWDSFLPAHGFDTVWSRTEMMKLAESDLGIKKSDWNGPEHRALNWGVHDDLSFQLLGDLLVNKTRDQQERVAKGEAKKPLFLNHYTISSHVNYKQRPKWYHQSKKPDFSALYEDEQYADNVKNYLEIRYFTDMELGKFLDRMADEGILDDTIVVISGDHGQGPEFGNDVPEDRDVSATRVAGTIIAEGRLGDAVGMVIDDATEQYDILNTLADITGVPDGGFEQDGVGRSLKRKIKFGERIVYSNNPTRKMSVVRGHERLRYDKVTDQMLLHNADTDHDMKDDLLPELTPEERAEWLKWRNNGRRVNSYYTKRWEGKCLLAAEC
ncbi:hypothetical protein KRP22_012577 [Phytophthora ramorum]|nr:hypothetical protein KRP22_13025 [Phytophthora ramorum]